MNVVLPSLPPHPSPFGASSSSSSHPPQRPPPFIPPEALEIAQHVKDEHLNSELPVVTQDLVPLSYTIDRVVAAIYSDLANLAETLPSQNDQARKRALVDFVLHSRRQLVKLLVLTRWTTEADRIQKAMNIIGFLSTQNHSLTSTIHSLTDTHQMLAGARVRNYDLPTALSVLTMGDYPALPSVVRESFEQEGKLSDDDVIETMREVEDLVRWRIVMGVERVPRGLREAPYRISDGRITFTSPGLWEASFTYGGSNSSEPEDPDEAKDSAEWYLLGVKFLFSVKDARGVWSPTPLGPQKDHLIQLCNSVLLRRPSLPPPYEPLPPLAVPLSTDQPQSDPPAAPVPTGAAALAEGEKEGEGKEGEGEQTETEEQRKEKWENERREVVRKRRRDRPLGRAYTFLQRLSLAYRLEAVYAQALKLAGTSWSGTLRVEMVRAGTPRATSSSARADGKEGKDAKGKGKEKEGHGKGKQGEKWEEDTVFVEYWSHPPPTSSSSSAAAKPPASLASTASSAPTGLGGVLVFTLQPQSSSSSSILSTSSSSSSSRLPTTSSSSRSSAARSRALQSALSRASYSPPSPTPSSSAALPAATPVPPAVNGGANGMNGIAGSSVTPAPSAREGTAAPVAAAEPGTEEKGEQEEEEQPLALSITWRLPPSSLLPSTLSSFSSSPSSSSPRGAQELDLSPSSASEDVDLETILERVTRVQARDLVRRLGREVGAAEEEGGAEEGKPRVVHPSLQGKGKGKGKEEQGDGAEEDDEVVTEGVEQQLVVPYLHFPLHNASHALAAFIHPQSGRFELRGAPSSLSSSTSLAGEGGPEGEGSTAAKEQRLRVATERVEAQRVAAAAGPGGGGGTGKGGKGMSREEMQMAWMRGVGDVVARIRVTTIIDDLETLLALLSLPPPSRRLPIPPREFLKFGPAFAPPSSSTAVINTNPLQNGRNAFTFIPLSHHAPSLPPFSDADSTAGAGAAAGAGKRGGLDGFYLAFLLLESSPSGLRPALVRTKEVSDGTTSWIEIVEVGWVTLPSLGKEKTVPFQPRPEEVRRLWRFAVQRAGVLVVEEGLSERRVPFRVAFSPGEGEGGEPYLVVPVSALVRDGGGGAGAGQGKEAGEKKKEEVAWPRAAVRVWVDEDGGVKVTLHARFHFPPSSSSSSSPSSNGRPDPQSLPPNILYNPKQDIVVFAAEGELEGSAEKLLRAYALVARSVSLAQQAHRNNQPTSASSATVPASPLELASASTTAAQQRDSNGRKNSLKIMDGVGVMPFG
ncbi:hypothetical protein JCM8547_001107 [Rhodosporidiobolus lusitaniae]